MISPIKIIVNIGRFKNVDRRDLKEICPEHSSMSWHRFSEYIYIGIFNEKISVLKAFRQSVLYPLLRFEMYTPSERCYMRIVLMTDSYYPTRDGVVTSVTMMRKSLEELGHDIWIVAPDPGEDKRVNDSKVLWIRSVNLKSYQGYYVPILPSLDKTRIEALNPDVIHVHGIATMAVRGLMLAHFLKIPAVMTFHTMVNEVAYKYSPIKFSKNTLDRLIWIYLRNVMKKMDAIIVPTNPIGSELKEHVTNMRLICTIPTGIDTDIFRPGLDNTVFGKKYGLSENIKHILHVGRISFEKEIDMVIRAMTDIDAELIIVGNGPQRKELEKLVSDLDLGNKVKFLGFIPDEDLPYAYAHADLLISCSAFETQGLSVLEAMSSGLPCVCRNARAFKDIIKDGENG